MSAPDAHHECNRVMVSRGAVDPEGCRSTMPLQSSVEIWKATPFTTVAMIVGVDAERDGAAGADPEIFGAVGARVGIDREIES